VLDSNPSYAQFITPQFLKALHDCPASSPVFTTHLKDVNIMGKAILISTDGTVNSGSQVYNQIFEYRASRYQNRQGTSTLDTAVSGVGNMRAVYNSTKTPLTSWNSTTGGVTTTYNVFAMLYNPSNLNTTQDTFVLSNEAPGYGISKLVTAGFGDYNLYDVLVAIEANTNPSMAIVIPDPFVNELASLPASSPVFVTNLANVNSPGTSIAISTDGTFQTVNIFGSSYQGAQKSSTLNTDVSGVGNFRAIYNSTTAPLTSWTNGSSGGKTTYNVFGIFFNPSGTTASSTPTSSSQTSNPSASSTLAPSQTSSNPSATPSSASTTSSQPTSTLAPGTTPTPQVPEISSTAVLLALTAATTLSIIIYGRKKATA
jgi:hypothetical protein